MFGIKVIGSFLLVLAGAGIGQVSANRLISRKRVLSEFLNKIKSFTIQLEYTAAPIDELWSKIQWSSHTVSQLFASLFSSVSEEKQQHNTHTTSNQYGLTSQDITLLEDFFKQLGKTDLRGQISHCRLYCQLFEQQLNQAVSEADKKIRICRTLGISCGCAAAIILI